MPEVAEKTPPKKLPVLLDPFKKHVYVLCNENPEREAGMSVIENGREFRINQKKFKPYLNLLMRSAIYWNGDPATKPQGWGNYEAGKRMIRYYDGCTTLFPEDQPKDKETVDQLMNSTRQRVFANGYLEVFDYEPMLKLYMDYCSYNEESPYKVPTISAIFKPINEDKQAEKEEARINALEKALELAKETKEDKMFIHGNFMGVSMFDDTTGNKLSEKAYRSAYRRVATEQPERFVATYDDKSIFTKYWIERAIETSEIRFNNNMAVWKSGSTICDLSGLKSHEGKVQKLVEFASLSEGEEFLSQLKALYNK